MSVSTLSDRSPIGSPSPSWGSIGISICRMAKRIGAKRESGDADVIIVQPPDERSVSCRQASRFPACAPHPLPALWGKQNNRERRGTALEAHPSVPLFRYPYTQLAEAEMQAKLAPAARAGPGSNSGPRTAIARLSRRSVTDGAATLNGQLGQGNRVTHGGATGGYGALTLPQSTLISHIVPDSTKAWAIAWD